MTTAVKQRATEFCESFKAQRVLPLPEPDSPETTPLDLPASWSLVAYLREGAMPVETALASIDGQMIVIKNNAGEVYWPELGIKQIEDLQPGQGYLVSMSVPGTLTYPAN